MRVALVVTNRSCNQNCGYCNARRPSDDPAFVAPRAVLSRIAAAAREGVGELVLGGGEPALRRDLERLVASARQAGVARIALDTNATLIDSERARRLRAAGLDVARCQLPAWGEDFDRITRDPGGFERAIAGLRALADAGVELLIAIPLTRSTREHAIAVPGKLESTGLTSRLVAVIPSDTPDPSEALALNDAASALEELMDAARSSGFTLTLSEDTLLPPCLFPKPGRVAHLYTLSRGGQQRPGYRQLDECRECRVADRCPGLPEAAFSRAALPELHPIREERVRRRLSVIASVDAQIERELSTWEEARRPDGSSLPMCTVRVNFQCNQACDFCFVSTHLPAAREDMVREAIVEGGKRRGVVALSGGEPTLNPRLVEYVALAKASGAETVELQTNATRLSDSALVGALVEAGLDTAFVSLHGSRAEISDAVTRAPGTFDKTVLGVDQVHAAGIVLRLNFVFCQSNLHDFPDTIRLIAARWPKALATVSFVAPSTDLVPRERWLVPRYSEVLPSMSEGLKLARELGVRVEGFESMCGLPLCLIPVGMEDYFGLSELAKGSDGGEFEKAPACADCSVSKRCYGIRRGYAELYGVQELKAVPG